MNSLKYSRASNSVMWFNGEETIFLINSLMTKTEKVFEMLLYSPFNHMTQLLAQKYFFELLTHFENERAC